MYEASLGKFRKTEKDIEKTFYAKTNMRIFAWNDKREKDTLMTPYDSIKYHRQMLQAGFMAMDPITGEVKAWVGGIGYKSFKYDHVNINTKRQVGSTMKPLLYSLAIEEAGFTPNTTVYDQQQSFGSYGLVPATGKSCTGQSMPMAAALAQSRNCASAYILKQFTVGKKKLRKNIDLGQPFLFYNMPLQRVYTQEEAEQLLFDFYLVNTEISPTGNKIRLIIDGTTNFIIDQWSAYLLSGLTVGEHSISIQLTNNYGKNIEGKYTSAHRKIWIE